MTAKKLRRGRRNGDGMEDIRVLVVDDEARMRKLVCDFLQKRGYMTLEAEDGEKAVELFFEKKNIDLILQLEF